jgi:hypothetical protein
MGGPLPLVMYRPDQDAVELQDGMLLRMVGSLIGWKVPGKSVWVMTFGGSVEAVEVPRP